MRAGGSVEPRADRVPRGAQARLSPRTARQRGTRHRRISASTFVARVRGLRKGLLLTGEAVVEARRGGIGAVCVRGCGLVRGRRHHRPGRARPGLVAAGVRTSGRLDAAADAFVRAIDAITRDDDETLFAATARLAALLQAHREQYQRILREASGRAAAYAVIGLAYRLELHDDIDAAKQACELAIASGRYQPARTAADALGRLLRVYEDIPNCKEEIARVGVPDRCSTEERSA